ncbi:MAG: site-2 protease family protein [Anaerolineales bacterium]|nr:site-2 protease family protein [Anaerolineales bacterium]
MFEPISAPAVPLDTVELVRQKITPYFTVADTTLDIPRSGHFRFRGRLLVDSQQAFLKFEHIFASYGYTPLLRHEQGYDTLVGLPIQFTPSTGRWQINLLLFLATVLSTLFAGALNEPAYTQLLDTAITQNQFDPQIIWQLWRGWPFCLSIMLILGAHELGHYFAARHHGVAATLPYFIPLPFSPFGTLGAVIVQRGPSRNVRVQFDIGASGPLIGLLFAIPILLIGLFTSVVQPLPPPPYMLEGNSILYSLLKFLVYGQFLPQNGQDVLLNQVAWAGWTGLFVTGLNLLPVGQLDGGRVTQAILGEATLRKLFWPILIALGLFSFLAGAPTWVLLIALLFVFGNRYEQPLDSITQLDSRRRKIGWFTMLLFLLLFVPIPLQMIN